jgi:hypothetical protein
MQRLADEQAQQEQARMRRARTADRPGMGDDAWRALYGVSDTASDVTRRVGESALGRGVKGFFGVHETDRPFWEMGLGRRDAEGKPLPMRAEDWGEYLSWLAGMGIAGTAYSTARRQLFGAMNPQGMPDTFIGKLGIGKKLKDDYQTIGPGLHKFEHVPVGTDPPNVAALREQGLVPNISWDELLAPDPNFAGGVVMDPLQPKWVTSSRWKVDPTDGRSWRLAGEVDQDRLRRELLDAMSARTSHDFNTTKDPELLRLLSIAEQSGIPVGARLQAGLAKILPEQDYITLYRGMSKKEADGLQEYLRLAGENQYEPGVLLGPADDFSPLRSFSMSPNTAHHFASGGMNEQLLAIDVPKKSIVMTGHNTEEELVVNVADMDFFRNARVVSEHPSYMVKKGRQQQHAAKKRAARVEAREEAEALARADVGVDQPYGGPEFAQPDPSGPPYHWKPGMPVVSTPQKYHILLQYGIVKKGQKLAGAETVPEWRAAVEKLWKKHRKDLGLG